MISLFPIAWTAMFVFGIVLGMPGAVLGLPDLAQRLHLSLVARGSLISSLFVGMLVGCLVSGVVVDRVGPRRGLVVAAALVACGLPLFLAATSFATAVATLGLLGVVAAGVNTAANALVSELYPTSRGRRMNMLALAVGLGGLTVAGSTTLAQVLPWQAVLLVAAALVAVVAVGAGLAAEPATSAASGVRGPLVPASLRTPTFVALGLLVMLSGANESSMAGWTTAFLAGAGLSPSMASGGLAGHWAGLIAGRIVIGPRVDRDKETALAVAGIAAAGGVLVMAIARTPFVLMAAPALIGLAIATLTPTALALAGDRFPTTPGAVFGAMLTLAQLGSAVVPAAIGAVAGRAGLRVAILLLAASSLGITALGRWLALRRAVR